MKTRPILFSAPMVRAVLDGSKTQTRRIVKPQPFLSPDTVEELTAGGRNLSDVVNDAWQCGEVAVRCPYGVPGDGLWVREAHRWVGQMRDRKWSGWVEYRADESLRRVTDPEHLKAIRPRTKLGAVQPWRPSIHMPRWASRITLEVTEVRVERLQEISEEDALAEGVTGLLCRHSYELTGAGYNCTDCMNTGWAEPPELHFKQLWDSINAKPKPVKVNGSVDHYVSYPWGGEQRTEAHRGLVHYIYPNPWIWAVSFKKLEGDSLAPKHQHP